MAVSGSNSVFISYAHSDGAQTAQRIARDIADRHWDVWLDKGRLTGGATWTKEIEEALDRAEIVLALLTSGAYVSEICRAEQLRALRKKKCVIPLLGQRSAEVPLHLEAKQYVDFSAPAQYAEQLEALFASMQARTGVDLKPKYQQTYVTAPPLPMKYLHRSEALERLRNDLLTDGGQGHVGLTALHGMGGIGKTVLAQALCHDEVMQYAFPDGIIWVTAGKERRDDLVVRLREAAKVLGDDLRSYDSELGAINRFRTVIRDKAALIVVDDVWDIRDVEPFCAESPRSRLLFTTRDASIGAAVGAREQAAELLYRNESLQMLAGWTGLQISSLPAEADEIIAECGRLPLALAVVGALLRRARRDEWKDTLELLRSADIGSIEEQLPSGRVSFFRAIQVSFDALTPKMQDHYRALAVLLEQMPAHVPILQTLWHTTEVETRRISRRFVDQSLAQRDEAGALHLHDLQLDYIRAAFPDRECLTMIHDALRLSWHVISRHPEQFASQITARLLQATDKSEGASMLRRFSSEIAIGAPRPWVRILQPTLDQPREGLIRTLVAGPSGIKRVVMSPDARRAMSVTRDGVVKEWDLETGAELGARSAGHGSLLMAVEVDSHWSLAVVVDFLRRLKLWDFKTEPEIPMLDSYSGSVTIESFGRSTWHAVAFSPDGRLAVCGRGPDLTIWDFEMGRELRTLKGHSDTVVSVTVTPNGRSVVSGSTDQTLKTWDLETGEELRTLEGHTDTVNSLAVSANGRFIVSGSKDRTIKVWELESGRALRTLEGHSDGVNSVTTSPDGHQVISGSADRTLKVWNLQSGSELRTLRGHSDWVNSVAVSPSGRVAISGSDDGTLKTWDLEAHTEMRERHAHSRGVNSVVVSPNGRQAVSASDDRVLKFWDVETGSELRTLDDQRVEVKRVAVCSDGRFAFSVFGDGTLTLRHLETGKSSLLIHPDKATMVAQEFIHSVGHPFSDHGTRALQGHSGKITSFAVSRDGRRAISASDDHTLKVWDLEVKREVHTLEGHSNSINSVTITPDGRLAVSASDDYTLKVWDLELGREVRTLEGHSDSVSSVTTTSDGQLAVSAADDKTLRVWDLKSGSELRRLDSHCDRIHHVAVNHNGSLALLASEDNTIKVCDLETGTEIRALQGHSAGVNSVAMSSDGKRAVSASNDTTLKVWDLALGREMRTFEAHSAVEDVALCADGGCVFSVCEDGTVRWWNISSGESRLIGEFQDPLNGVAITADHRQVLVSSSSPVSIGALFTYSEKLVSNWGSIKNHSEGVNGIAISHDGRLAISASADRTLKIWDVETGLELRTLEGHSDKVNSVAITSDGRLAVSASADRTLKVWDVETGLELRTLEGHSDAVNAVKVSQDGRLAISASDDTMLKIWNVETGAELHTLASHSQSVRDVSVSWSARRAFSASRDKTVRVWDLETAAPVATFTADADLNCCAGVQGRYIVAGDISGRVHFLVLELAEPQLNDIPHERST